MADTFYTGKNGRHSGSGDPSDRLIVGEGAPRDSPFYWLPYNLQTARENFFYWDLNQHGYVAAHWTETLVDAGSGTTSIAPSADGLLFTNAGNEDDGGQIQMIRNFDPAAGKYALFYWQQKSSEATEFDFANGWYGTDTTVVASIPTHAAGFRKDDGDTIINGVTKDGTTASDTANLITTYAADTLYDFAVCINSDQNVSFHYKLASVATWTKLNKTTNKPTAVVRPTFAQLNGSAAAHTMTITKATVAWLL